MKFSVEQLARIRALENEEELLMARSVVEDARSAESPLHDLFQWDDSIAGERYRLIQARGIIRSIRVTIQTSELQVVAPAYLRAPDLPGNVQGYRRTTALAQDVDEAREALRSELQRVQSALGRAQRIATALGLAGEVEEMLLKLSALQVSMAEPVPQSDATH